METTKEVRALFNSKHAHIFVAAFKAFLELGHEEAEFKKFLGWFTNSGSRTEIDGKTWKTWDENKATRDTAIVHGKISYLMSLVELYTKKIRKAA